MSCNSQVWNKSSNEGSHIATGWIVSIQEELMAIVDSSTFQSSVCRKDNLAFFSSSREIVEFDGYFCKLRI